MQRLVLPSSTAAAANASRGGARWRLLRLRAALSTLPYSRTAVAASASTTTSSINGGQRRRRPLPLCPPRAALGTKAGGDGGPPHPELFLAELFGGVVNKPREGTVIQLHEGSVARVSGLRDARIHDVVAFVGEGGEEGGNSVRRGLVVDLEQNTVAVALLDADPPVREGEAAILLGGEEREGASQQGPSIPVGAALLGRVVDPLGRPLAGLDPLSRSSAASGGKAGAAGAGGGGGGKNKKKGVTAAAAPTPTAGAAAAAAAVPLDPEGVVGEAPLLHRAAPGIMARKPLCARLATGVKALDVFHPLAHGQCFGVLGKFGSGKTSLALQVVVNQRDVQAAEAAAAAGGLSEGGVKDGGAPPAPPLRCVYVATGQEENAVMRAVEQLQREGCLGYVTVVAATADMPPGLRYLAPFAGCALGEHWADQGGRALVVFDDLSRHAEAYSDLAKFMSKPEVETGLALHGPLLERFAQLSDARGGGAMTGLALVDGEANEGEAGGGLAHRINSIVDHAINLNLDLARRRAFPAVDVAYQMNLQSPGTALLPEPTKAFVQNLRVTLAEALDDEAGAKMAEELGIRADDEAEEAKVERLAYLKKVRLLFLQQSQPPQNQQGAAAATTKAAAGASIGGAVDEGGLLLYLLACLKEEMLLDLDADVVKQLDGVLSGELPRAKGWRRLRAQVAALARHPDARTVAEAFLQAHQARHKQPGLGGRPVGPLSASASIGEGARATAQEAERVYAMLHDVLMKAVNYSRKKALVARMSEGGGSSGSGSERIKDRAAAIAALKRRNNR